MQWIILCDYGHGVWTFISSDTDESNRKYISKLEILPDSRDTDESNRKYISKLEHLPDYLKLYRCHDVELITPRQLITPRRNDAKETGKDVSQFTGIETIRF